MIVANGGFKYVGTSADALLDAKGKPLGKAFLEAEAKAPRAGRTR